MNVIENTDSSNVISENSNVIGDMIEITGKGISGAIEFAKNFSVGVYNFFTGGPKVEVPFILLLSLILICIWKALDLWDWFRGRKAGFVKRNEFSSEDFEVDDRIEFEEVDGEVDEEKK